MFYTDRKIYIASIPLFLGKPLHPVLFTSIIEYTFFRRKPITALPKLAEDENGHICMYILTPFLYEDLPNSEPLASQEDEFLPGPLLLKYITKTCPYIIQHFFADVKMIIEAVLTSTHNLYIKAKIRNNVYPRKPQFYYIKVGCEGVNITRTCYHDELVLLCLRVLTES